MSANWAVVGIEYKLNARSCSDLIGPEFIVKKQFPLKEGASEGNEHVLPQLAAIALVINIFFPSTVLFIEYLHDKPPVFRYRRLYSYLFCVHNNIFSLVHVHRSPGKISSCYTLRLKLKALILSNPHLCNHTSRRATPSTPLSYRTACLLRYRSPFSHFRKRRRFSCVCL